MLALQYHSEYVASTCLELQAPQNAKVQILILLHLFQTECCSRPDGPCSPGTSRAVGALENMASQVSLVSLVHDLLKKDDLGTCVGACSASSGGSKQLSSPPSGRKIGCGVRSVPSAQGMRTGYFTSINGIHHSGE